MRILTAIKLRDTQEIKWIDGTMLSTDDANVEILGYTTLSSQLPDIMIPVPGANASYVHPKTGNVHLNGLTTTVGGYFP